MSTTHSGLIVSLSGSSHSSPDACSQRELCFVFATREVGDTLGQLPVLQVEPLGRRDARSLLESVLPTPLDERVVERLILETGGIRLPSLSCRGA